MRIICVRKLKNFILTHTLLQFLYICLLGEFFIAYFFFSLTSNYIFYFILCVENIIKCSCVCQNVLTIPKIYGMRNVNYTFSVLLVHLGRPMSKFSRPYERNFNFGRPISRGPSNLLAMLHRQADWRIVFARRRS